MHLLHEQLGRFYSEATMTNTPQSCRIDNLREQLPRDCGVFLRGRTMLLLEYTSESQERNGTNAVRRALLSRQGANST